MEKTCVECDKAINPGDECYRTTFGKLDEDGHFGGQFTAETGDYWCRDCYEKG